MKKKEAIQRVKQLRTVINHHRYLYHVHDTQELSDAVLDSLKHELYNIESVYPDLITPDSPTQRVGGQPLDTFEKITHGIRMLSLEDVFSREEFMAWTARISRFSKNTSAPFPLFGEVKFDGIAVSLIYRNGLFVEGSTRGDGTVGENITQNLRTVESIPLRIETHTKEFVSASRMRVIKNGTIEIRGEIVITKKAFTDINKQQKKKGEKIYANPRNLAAGSVRQLDPAITKSRKLVFMGYDVVTDVGQKTHEESHHILTLLGFRSDPLARVLYNTEDVLNLRNEIEKKREQLPYHIDGLVLTGNDIEAFRSWGVVGKAPRGSVAFKFPAEEAITRVRDIHVQVGRTGVLTPVAYLEPVRIGGVLVSRATLHNMDEIRRLDVRVGDTVVVGRAGDVIPDVRSVLVDLRSGTEQPFRMPKKCPICNQLIEKKESEVAFKCVNKNCPALKREGLYHMISKKGFDIDGLGSQIIDVLLDNNLIQDTADLYNLTEGDIAPLDRFGEKSAENLIHAIQKRRQLPVVRFLYALGIPHIGEETARLLAEMFPVSSTSFTVKHLLHRFQKISKEEFEQIDGIGDKVADSVKTWFDDRRNQAFLEKLDGAGILLDPVPANDVVKTLTGKRFVITGSLSSMSREKAESLIRERGGETTNSVSKKIDILIAGNNPGTKREKAEELGISIFNEERFLKLLGDI